jgi:aminocarboxymuconate-semialdehyde decarboxylase
MIVDCHAHLVPPALLDEIRARASEFPSVEVREEGGSLAFAFAGRRPTRPVSRPLSDISGRCDWMDGQGIGRQVVGGWLDMFGYEIPAGEGLAWSRLVNRHLLAAGHDNRRFVPLATVPLQDGAAAAEILTEAMEAGFAGVMIGTQPKGAGGVLDDADLEPFWAAAHRLGAVVFVHPVFESGDDRVHDYGMANAIGRVTDTMIAMSRLLYSGHVLDYSGARIVASVGGAALPYVAGRLRRNHAIAEGLADPDAALRALYYDTVVHDARTLRFLVDSVGADRVMMGSDMPFPIGDPEPMGVVAAAGLGAAETDRMNGGLAAELFGL